MGPLTGSPADAVTMQCKHLVYHPPKRATSFRQRRNPGSTVLNHQSPSDPLKISTSFRSMRNPLLRQIVSGVLDVPPCTLGGSALSVLHLSLAVELGASAAGQTATRAAAVGLHTAEALDMEATSAGIDPLAADAI